MLRTTNWSWRDGSVIKRLLFSQRIWVQFPAHTWVGHNRLQLQFQIQRPLLTSEATRHICGEHKTYIHAVQTNKSKKQLKLNNLQGYLSRRTNQISTRETFCPHNKGTLFFSVLLHYCPVTQIPTPRCYCGCLVWLFE